MTAVDLTCLRVIHGRLSIMVRQGDVLLALGIAAHRPPDGSPHGFPRSWSMGDRGGAHDPGGAGADLVA